MSEPSVLDRCRRGEGAAWRLLFDTFGDSVYRWALCFGLDRANAEELTQEVFVTASRAVGRCPAEHLVGGWLFQITRRHAANLRRTVWFRRVIGLGSRDDSDGRPAAEGARGYAAGHELSFDLRRALERLPSKLVETLILSDVEGYSRDEIAALLGIPPGTVASRLQKARDSLARSLR